MSSNYEEPLHPIAEHAARALDLIGDPLLSPEAADLLREALFEIDDGHELAHAVRSLLRMAWAVEGWNGAAAARALTEIARSAEARLEVWSERWTQAVEDVDRSAGTTFWRFTRDGRRPLPMVEGAPAPEHTLPLSALYQPSEMPRAPRRRVHRPSRR
jgi:hypothetical protein